MDEGRHPRREEAEVGIRGLMGADALRRKTRAGVDHPKELLHACAIVRLPISGVASGQEPAAVDEAPDLGGDGAVCGIPVEMQIGRRAPSAAAADHYIGRRTEAKLPGERFDDGFANGLCPESGGARPSCSARCHRPRTTRRRSMAATHASTRR